MASERVQRRLERLLDQIDESESSGDWKLVHDLSRDVLAIDRENKEATAYLDAAQRRLAEAAGSEGTDDIGAASDPPATRVEEPPLPTSFASGRYKVKRFLGEGGKKKVYLANDTSLDRDVAFLLIKTEGLDDAARARVTREAQTMGRLGDHPNIVHIHDFGDEAGQPYMVQPLMTGGDVEGLIEKAEEHRLPLERTLEIASSVCRGLEFAHTKGVVHRDLKPGNVMLTGDGTAMIGDFGLALPIERSRLTQEGTMVGTVSYMPPEQAMGGEVTPQADLYSLGAMLYEMVTGRPPFVGDESVAIITQHLNTPPVAPTWHNPDCPPGLEVLILRLLEKNPGDRFASAAEVRKVLEGIDLTEVPVPTDVAQPVQNPMYRTTFVGREQELRQLQQAWDGALSGQGGLQMVVGEPGIGKTSLWEQLATYVSVRGGRALVGHSYEEGSLSLPYLPFIEAIRSYVQTREPEALRTELGSGAEPVARIVSEVRDKVEVEFQTPGDPEEERYRLLQGVTTFLTNAANVQPLLLVLEDLHDADNGSLDLLVHLARNLQGARLLVVGTYRDVEVDRAHPLSGVLANLRRVGSFGRVLLRGLTVNEVHRMVNELATQDVPNQLAEAIHRQTEGNPLFVQEVLRYLVEEGLVQRRGASGIGSGEQPLAERIPEGLRDVIGKRLSRLSEATNRILSVAAVNGREFRLDVLQQIAGLPEEELLNALEEAKDVSLIEERTAVGAVVTYRFTHAFFRQTLYDETIAPRRIRLHQQVGVALEQVYGRRLDEHAAELAEHFSYSSAQEDLAKVVRYGEMAADRAMAVFDYGEAARLLAKALQVQEVLDIEDKAKRCDLLLALGEALLPAGDPKRAYESVASEAFSLAEEIGDDDRASLACRLAINGLRRYATAAAVGTPEWSLWMERADHHAKPDTVHRAYANTYMAWAERGAGNWVQSVALLRPALELARRLDDAEALYVVASPMMQMMLQSSDPQHLKEALRLAEEFSARPRAGVTARTFSSVLQVSARIFLRHGDRERLDNISRQVRELALHTQDAGLLVSAWAGEGSSELIEGRFEDVVATAERLVALGDELGSSGTAREHAAQISAIPLLYLGRTQEALDVIDQWARHGGRGGFTGGVRAIVEASMGRNQRAQELLLRYASRRQMTSDGEYVGAEYAPLLLEMALMLEDKETTSLLAREMEVFGHLFFFWGPDAINLGRAAALLGNPEKARAYYHQALEVATKFRSRPHIARTRLYLAELLLEHYPDERTEALEHLDFSIGEFRDMKMQPSLERALRHRDILKA